MRESLQGAWAASDGTDARNAAKWGQRMSSLSVMWVASGTVEDTENALDEKTERHGKNNERRQPDVAVDSSSAICCS